MNVLRNIWTIELIWWISAALLAALILFPIHFYKIEFEFYTVNFFYIFGLILFVRWIFLWKYTPYAWWIPFKLVVLFLMIPVVFWGITSFYGFKGYLDEVGIQEFVSHLNEADQSSLSVYIRTEMIFFASAFIFSGCCIPLKMIASIWKQYNRNTV